MFAQTTVKIVHAESSQDENIIKVKRTGNKHDGAMNNENPKDRKDKDDTRFEMGEKTTTSDAHKETEIQHNKDTNIHHSHQRGTGTNIHDSPQKDNIVNGPKRYNSDDAHSIKKGTVYEENISKEFNPYEVAQVYHSGNLRPKKYYARK